MTKKYKVGDTVYAKGKIIQVDESHGKFPYCVAFSDSNIPEIIDTSHAWLDEDSFVEPLDKPTLPKGVAYELEQAKCDVKNFDWYIKRVVNANSDLHCYPQSTNYWLSGHEESVTAILLNAWKNGYTIDKPKLYNLILSEDYYKGAVVCLYKPIQTYELYTISSINDDDLKHNKKYQFTQEEIDEYNKSFWIKNLDLNDYKVEVRTDEE